MLDNVFKVAKPPVKLVVPVHQPNRCMEQNTTKPFMALIVSELKTSGTFAATVAIFAIFAKSSFKLLYHFFIFATVLSVWPFMCNFSHTYVFFKYEFFFIACQRDAPDCLHKTYWRACVHSLVSGVVKDCRAK